MPPKSRSLPLGRNMIASLVFVCAILMIGWRIYERVSPRQAQGSVTTVEEWRQFSQYGNVLSSVDGEVTVVEFGDYLCPHCRASSIDLMELSDRSDLAFTHVFRHSPWSGDSLSWHAAIAAECAASQKRFAAFHRSLFEQVDSLRNGTWLYFATVAEVPDLAQFDRCVSNSETAHIVQRDVDAGALLENDVTPTILVNDIRLNGYPGLEMMTQFIRGARESEQAR